MQILKSKEFWDRQREPGFDSRRQPCVSFGSTRRSPRLVESIIAASVGIKQIKGEIAVRLISRPSAAIKRLDYEDVAAGPHQQSPLSHGAVDRILHKCLRLCCKSRRTRRMIIAHRFIGEVRTTFQSSADGLWFKSHAHPSAEALGYFHSVRLRTWKKTFAAKPVSSTRLENSCQVT
jgi:hypothetical protein